MPSLSVKYQLTYPEYREAILAVSPRTRPWAWWLLGVLLLYGAIAILLVLINPFHVPTRLSPPWALLMLVAFIQLLLITWLYATRVSRSWKRQPQLRLPHELIIDDVTLTERWQSTSVQTTWDNVRLWKETPNILVIGTNLGLFLISKRQLTDFERNQLAALATAHTKLFIKSTGGFPIEPSS